MIDIGMFLKGLRETLLQQNIHKSLIGYSSSESAVGLKHVSKQTTT